MASQYSGQTARGLVLTPMIWPWSLMAVAVLLRLRPGQGAEAGYVSVLPQVGAVVFEHVAAAADDLAALVDVGGPAFSGQCAETAHHSALPEKRAPDRVPVRIRRGGLARSDHLAAVVDRDRVARRAAERSEVGHAAVLPDERVRGRFAVSGGG